MGNELNRLYEIIESYSGIRINEAHKTFMQAYVQKRLTNLEMNLEDYCDYLLEHKEEFTKLIDEAAINETYFFREEQQFKLISEKYFPLHLNEHLILWSAACSTGEEPVSLYALTTQMNLNADIYATDIDMTAMGTLKNGKYGLNSFRDDGRIFHPLLKSCGTKSENGFSLDQNIFDRIHISQFNLVNQTNPPVMPGSVDIIFLRNAFIYFSTELRIQILTNLSKFLKEDGLFFLSMNEIASVECPIDIPLVKENTDRIYYFRKVSDRAKREKIAKPVNLAKLTETPLLQKTSVTDKSLNEQKAAPVKVQKIETIEVKPAKTEQKKSGELRLEDLRKLNMELNKINTDEKRKIFTRDELNSFCNDFYRLLDEKNFEELNKLLNNSTFKVSYKEYEYYFKGIIFNNQQNVKDAISNFSMSTFSNRDFWPASFELGLLYKSIGNDKEMKNAFTSCINSIKKHEETDKVCYNDVIQSFSPSYYLDLCRTYIKQADNK